MEQYKEELTKICEMLNSPDTETIYLGYELLRNSEFKKAFRGKVWTTNNMSFYKFNLYGLIPLSNLNGNQFDYAHCHNWNRIGFAQKVVRLALDNKIKLKTVK